MPEKSPKSGEQKVEPKSSSESSTPKVKVIKQGVPRTVAKPITSGTKKMPATVTRGPVKRATAKAGHAPAVTKPVTGSKERKVIEQTTDEPFWHKVKRKYFV